LLNKEDFSEAINIRFKLFNILESFLERERGGGGWEIRREKEGRKKVWNVEGL